jgi:hypothetical protein
VPTPRRHDTSLSWPRRTSQVSRFGPGDSLVRVCGPTDSVINHQTRRVIQRDQTDRPGSDAAQVVLREWRVGGLDGQPADLLK